MHYKITPEEIEIEAQRVKWLRAVCLKAGGRWILADKIGVSRKTIQSILDGLYRFKTEQYENLKSKIESCVGDKSELSASGQVQEVGEMVNNEDARC